MSIVSNKVNLAKRELRKSIVYINENIVEEIKEKNANPLFFGIKDTNQIPEEIIERLRASPHFVWLTIDKASNRGRAIDTDLMNPVTYRAMTGSTSGGPINIVKGINDFAVGTDGGGSVLAPAMSCQLPSMIGSGLDALVKKKKSSTEGIEFIGSLGVVAKNIPTLKKVMECITDVDLSGDIHKSMKIIVPKKGTVRCADQEDMYERVMSYITKLEGDNFIIREIDMSGIDDRSTGIKVIRESFEEYDADLIITCEGPVDVYGYGETIPQFFGKPGMEITRNHGKYLLRAANMSQTTAITVPIGILASGLVIIARKGLNEGRNALRIAEELEKVTELPEVWGRYFVQETDFTGLELR